MFPAAASTALPLTAEYSGFLRRFWAWCIDTPLRFVLGLALVFLPVRFLVLGEIARYGTTDARYLWNAMPAAAKAMVLMLWLFVAVIAPWLYTALQESAPAQASLGKRLLGVQVADLRGRRISFGRASVRYLARLLPTFGIGYLMALFTARKQALHDIIAGCVVIRNPTPLEKAANPD